jgi:hypothetical protein
MPVPKCEKPATAASVNRLERDDRLGRQINFTANASSQLGQAFDHNLHDAFQLLPAPPISSPQANYGAARVRCLAEQIHGLGPRPLFELLAEIVCGAPSMERIERYARLSREHGDFIHKNGGDQFPPRFFIVNGNDSNDFS